MTENEWEDATDSMDMLAWVKKGGHVSKRKCRLFACAVCRRWWYWLTDERSRNGVEVAERFADKLVSRKVLAAAHLPAALSEFVTRYVASPSDREAASGTALAAISFACGDANKKAERREQAAQLRDIFGPLPFRQLRLDPSWLAWNGGTVVRLAQAAYEERALPEGRLDNARLAVVADALEEAACTETEVLRHLREQGGVHVRGCWCVDLILGKT
jgi:hypothetical protein